MWAETCFFARWFGEQSAAQRELVRQLVAARQLEFVGCQREPESLQIADRRAAMFLCRTANETAAALADCIGLLTGCKPVGRLRDRIAARTRQRSPALTAAAALTDVC